MRTGLAVVVVDDETVARRRLRRLLTGLEGVEVVGEAAHAEEALSVIDATAPDVVLLDIQMPEVDGIELAQQLPQGLAVVFVTAFERYAVQAFEAAAVDYLLKPVSAERLAAALDRVRRLERGQDARTLRRLAQRLRERDEPPRIAARSGESVHLFDPAAIARFHAQRGYTAFQQDGRRYLLDESIAELESRLEEWGFLRVHRSELIRLAAVRGLRKIDDQVVIDLEDGQQAPVSRRRVTALKRALGIASS